MTSVEDDFTLVTSAVWNTTLKQIINVNDNFAPMISVNHKDDVTKDGDLKDLFGKAEQVYHAATLTFNVK